MAEEKKPKEFENSFEKLILQAVSDCDLHSDEIPNIDLYIDQILTLVADKNEQSEGCFKDNVLTKTMINNYSKNGILSPIKGKKYTKEHIIEMLLIYSLKNSLSISEIGRLMHGIVDDGTDSGNSGEKAQKSLEENYEKYLEIKDKCRKKACDSAKELVLDENLELSDICDCFSAISGILSYSAYLKSIALSLLYEKFPDKSADVKAEKTKEKDKKKKAENDGKENEKNEIKTEN